MWIQLKSDRNILTKNLSGDLNERHLKNDRWEGWIISLHFEKFEDKAKGDRDDVLSSNIKLTIISINWGECKTLAGQAKSVKSIGCHNWTWYFKMVYDSWALLSIHKEDSWKWWEKHQISVEVDK